MSVSTAEPTHRTPAHQAHVPRRAVPEWVDRFLGSDPGLTRLLTALQAVATIGAAMLAEWAFVRWTHALQVDTHGAVLPPQQAALIAAQHHGVLVIAILLGAITGMIASFSAAMFVTPGTQLASFLLLPVPMLSGMALGLALAPHRVLALASLVVVLVVGAYLRRFRAWGFVGGMLLFMGDFFGFFLNGALHLSDLGWVAAEIGIGVLVTVVAHFTLFYPSRRAALSRMRRSYAARARGVATAALAVVEERGDRLRAQRRLQRRLIRLNEAALLVDGQLSHPGALPHGWSATALHQRLFDSELALTNLARFAGHLAGADLPDGHHELIAQALAAVAEMDVLRAEFAAHELLGRLRAGAEGTEGTDGAKGTEGTDGPDGRDAAPAARTGGPSAGLGPAGQDLRVVTHRFAISVLGFSEAVQGWRDERAMILAGRPIAPPEPEPFTSQVMIFGGWLPGSAMVSAAASVEPGPPLPQQLRWRDRLRHWDRVRLAPNVRVAIQMGVAVTAAMLLGDLISGRRFYWAVLAAFITFMGANNAGEQLRKGFFRVAGTVIGVLLGALGAHLVGDRTGVAIAVILGALFVGMYLMRISYVFMTIGVTIMVSQLYVQLDEFSDSLLELRLEETAVGAAVTALVVLCVLPLRTGRVARVAVRHYLQALAGLIDPALTRLTQGGGDLQLRAALRRLDAAYQTLLATVVPLRVPLVGSDSARDRLLQAASGARHYARNLLTDTTGTGDCDPRIRQDVEAAGKRLTDSLGEVIAHLQDEQLTSRVYVRSAALFDMVATQMGDRDYLAPAQLALRDLQLLDGAGAAFARTFGLDVRALDTDDAVRA